MLQFLVEEAAATALELHEAQLAAAETAASTESDVRTRHLRLMQQAPEAV